MRDVPLCGNDNRQVSLGTFGSPEQSPLYCEQRHMGRSNFTAYLLPMPTSMGATNAIPFQSRLP